MEDMFFVLTEDELFGEDWLNCNATEILDAQYEWTDVTDVVNKMIHLIYTAESRSALSAT